MNAQDRVYLLNELQVGLGSKSLSEGPLEAREDASGDLRRLQQHRRADVGPDEVPGPAGEGEAALGREAEDGPVGRGRPDRVDGAGGAGSAASRSALPRVIREAHARI